MTTNDAVAKRILQLMREKNMSRYRLEQLSGVYHSVLHRILHGKNNTITLATIYKLANGFDMTVIDFINNNIFLSENIDIE